MKSSLDMNINTKSLLKFTLPSIISMVVMSVFGAIDGVFISRYIDIYSLSAANIAMPILTATMAIGFMIAAGGSALVATKKGEGLDQEARENFSLLIYVAFVVSTLLAVVSLIFLEPLLRFLGSNELLLPLAKEYIRPITIAIPIILLGFIFQKFLIADGKPTLAMFVSSIGAIMSAVLNYVFIYLWGMGLRGASIATTIGYSLPTLVGVIYFTFFRKSGLYFVKPCFDFKVITKSTTNGISEFISMMAVTVTSTFMNNIIMEVEGPMGVAAVGIMLTIQGLVTSLFLGYAFGISPIISYNYGKKETANLKKIYSLSLKIITVLSIFSVGITQLFASPLTEIYVPAGTVVYEMTVFGLRLISISFILIAFNTFASGMFTAFNNGWVSGILSFFRTLVFLVISLLILPRSFGMNGVWLSLPFAEVLSAMMTIYYLRKMAPVYHYKKAKEVNGGEEDERKI